MIQRNPKNQTSGLLDTSIIRHIRIEMWERVLVLCELKPPDGQRVDHDYVERCFDAADADHRLWDALQTIHELGSDHGNESIAKAAKASGYRYKPEKKIGKVEGACETALALWIDATFPGEQQTQAKLTLDFATIICGLHRLRTSIEARGESPLKPTVTAAKLSAIVAQVQGWCTSNDVDGQVTIKHREIDGEWVFRITRGSRRVVVNHLEGVDQKRYSLVPCRCDIISYDGSTGILRVSAHVQGDLMGMYLTTFGSVLFGKLQFFQDEGGIDLSPLKNPDVLKECLRYDIDTAELRSISWRGRRGEVRLTSGRYANCYQAATDEGMSLADRAAFTKATIAIKFIGTEKRREQALIHVATPDKIGIPDGILGDRVRRFLRAIGILKIRPHRDQAIAMWRRLSEPLNEQTWRNLYQGKVFERLVQTGVLTVVQTTEMAMPSDPSVIASITQLPSSIHGSDAILIAEGNEGVTELIGQTARNHFAFNGEKYRSLLCSSMGLTADYKPYGSFGISRIGSRRFPIANSDRMLTVYWMDRQPTEGAAAIADLVSQLAGTSDALVIIPTGVGIDGIPGIKTVVWDCLTVDFDELMRKSLEILGWTKLVNPTLWVPKMYPIIVAIQGERVRAWDNRPGKEQEIELKAPVEDTLRILVSHMGDDTPSSELGAGNVEDAGTTARDRIRNLRNRFDKELRETLVYCPQRKVYRLGDKVFVMQ